MVKQFGWGSIALAVVVAACSGDNALAPGVCPAYCVGVTVRATDTLLRAAAFNDSTFTGYVQAPAAAEIMVTSPSAPTEARGVLRFFRFTDTLTLDVGDTVLRPVLRTDSFQVQFVVARRTAGVDGMRLAFYRLPVTVDTLSTFAALDPYFNDSTFVVDVAVPSADSSDTVRVTFPSSALPNFAADSLQAALGVALRSPSPAFVSLKSSEAGFSASLSRYVTVDSIPNTPVTRIATFGTAIDTYVFPPFTPAGAGILTIGGAPSNRTFVHLDLPRRIVDSSNVVRATLFLIPAGPVLTAPGDTLRVVAHPLAADLGAKSPILSATVDTAFGSGGRVPPGVNDTIKVDITTVVQGWKADTTQSHTVLLRISPEAGSLGELRFWSSTDPRRPLLDITYVPPINYQGR